MSTPKTPSVVLPFLLVFGCRAPYASEARQHQVDDLISTPQDFPKSWLLKRVSIASAEQENLIRSKAAPQNPVPFMDRLTEWNEFKSKLNVGGDLWYWESPRYGNADSYKQCQGFAITKDGSITAVFKNRWVITYKDR